MDDQSARRVLLALAQGFDPMSGAPLAQESPLASPEVMHALLAAIGAIEQRIAMTARRRVLPSKVGTPWSTEEEAALLQAFDAGRTVQELAASHARTVNGIEARLEKLGRLNAEQRSTRNRFASQPSAARSS
jgi:hypothetical protein